MMFGRNRGEFPKVPPDFVGASANWNMSQLGKVIEQACGDEAQMRYESAHRMVEAIESCRELSYDSLFRGLESSNVAAAETKVVSYAPIAAAAIHAAPWTIAALAALLLVSRYL